LPATLSGQINTVLPSHLNQKHEMCWLIQSKPEYMIPEDALYHRSSFIPLHVLRCGYNVYVYVCMSLS